MLKFYDSPPSGNCYKVRLLLHQLQIPYQRVVLNSRQGQTRTPDFEAKNPFAQVPALELETGEILTESAALLLYLADETPLAGSTQMIRARVAEWLFIEQSRVFPQLGMTRFWLKTGQEVAFAHEISIHHQLGSKTLKILDQHLSRVPFLAGEHYTIADIANYAYTHVAHEAGFDLDPLTHLQQWFERIQSQPGFIPPETA